MAERNTGYGRTRSRDPDHRLPAYQVLEKIQSKSPNPRYGRRTEVQPHVHSYKASTRITPISDMRGLNSSKSNDGFEKRHGIISQRPLCQIHTTNTSSESVSSALSSQSRRPACSFAHQFYVLNDHEFNNNNSWGRNNRSKSLSPGTKFLRYHSTPPRYLEEDDEDDEEPNDVVVWNASKRTSRSNMLCPLTDSEMCNMARDERHQRYKMGQRFVEKSNLQHQSEQHGKILDLDDDDQEEEELLEDSSPPIMSNDESSVSLATTSYSKQIALVTQELESIQQAQNDILSQLGEDMIIVSSENERLKKEIDHVRNQNEGLLKVVHDTTQELDRVKQILKKFGIPQSNILPDNKNEHEHKQDKAWSKSEKLPLRKEASDESPTNIETPEHHPKQRSRSRDSNTSSGSRRSKAESAGSSGSGHSHHEEHYSRTQEMHDHREFGGSGTVTQTKGKERRRRKSSASVDADDSDEDNEGNHHPVHPRHVRTRSRYEDDNSSQRSNDSHNSQNSATRKLQQRNHSCSEVDKVGGGDVLGKPKLKSRSRSRERRHESELVGERHESYKDQFRETEKVKKRSRSRSKDSKDNNKNVGSEKKKGPAKEKDKEKEKRDGMCFNVCGCCFPGAPYADDSDDELFVTDADREIHR